jgi:hypothetical protein
MSDPEAKVDRLSNLTAAVCDGSASDRDVDELDAALIADEQSRRRYLKYCRLHVSLEMEMQARSALRRLQARDRIDAESLTPWESEALAAATPPIPSAPSALASPGVFSAGLYGSVGYLASGWPVAYLIATAILSVGLLIGAVTHVSRPEQQFASLPSPFGRGAGGEGGERLNSPLPSVVGQITAMANCRLAAGSRSKDLRPKTALSLGDKFVLRSGLMEIAYDTGASVILQGPVTYEVESSAGGYLSVGKLTAKVEGETNHKSEIINPKFIVRTPTAVVTDLGTEFGVEVDKLGGTTSHVFRGSVRVQVLAGKSAGTTRILRENQSARVSADAESGGVVVLAAAVSPAFVREIPKQTIKVLDLADVVASGDGFSGRRNRGIDPHSGQVAQTPGVDNRTVVDDGKYHRVAGMPFVDGVFVPCGRRGPVQLDSAGHSFAWFPSVAPYTFGTVWAGKDAITTAELSGTDYSSPGHAMIELHANKAITFDLAAIRRANPGWKLMRFSAVAGNTAQSHPKASVFADLWVFVDGQVRFQRREINRYNGAMPAVVPISDKDRFLTLAATDGGDNIGWDHTIFGDPRLEMVPVKASVGSAPPQERAEH